MRGMAKADFYTALFLMVLGIGVVEESWRMPRFADLGQSVWSSPGITPGMIGAVLAIMGAILFFRSRKELRASADGRRGDRLRQGAVGAGRDTRSSCASSSASGWSAACRSSLRPSCSCWHSS